MAEKYAKTIVVDLIFKSGKETRFTVEFSEPLTSSETNDFCDMIFGKVDGDKLKTLKLPVSESQVVFMKFDEVAFIETHIEWQLV